MLSHLLSHGYFDGNQKHCILVRSICAEVSKPWYKLLWKWLEGGILEGVHDEFFVEESSSGNNTRTCSSSMTTMGSRTYAEQSVSSGYYSWHERFILRRGMVPHLLLTGSMAHECLAVGKGINFIRYCLMDRDWELNREEDGMETCDAVEEIDEKETNVDREDTASDLDFKSPTKQQYPFTTLSDLTPHQDTSHCISTLHTYVLHSSTKIHRHILNSLLHQHHLLKHLHALKRFLFLGQGDFISAIVESFHNEFRGRNSLAGIYSHTLYSVLEGAVRTSNARYLEEVVLERLNVKLLGVEDGEGYWMGHPPKDDEEEELVAWEDDEEGVDPWDHVCLEYVINSPLDAIVHRDAMDSYHRVFMFLFRLKRVEWMLNNSWRQSTALNHAILIETKAGGADAPHISSAAEQCSFLLRRISSTRQTMLHFVSNLQNYLMFEVLEGGWEGLVKSVNSATSLDGLISAHDLYLNEILVKTLLSNQAGEGQENGKGKSLEDLLRRLLSIALKFGKFQDFIFVNASAALNKSARTRRRVAETSKSGTWGRKTVDEEEGRVFMYLADANLFQFVENTSREFDRVLGSLLKMLKKEVFDDGGSSEDDSQPSLNHDALRFLLFRLDYSGYYHRQAKARSKKSSGGSTTA